MIKKNIFIQALQTIQEQLAKDKVNSLLIKEAFSINDDFVYDTSHLQMQIIDLLAIWFDKEDLIHYCYETNFGKPSSESECLEIGDFYDFLIKDLSSCKCTRKCKFDDCQNVVSNCGSDFCSKKHQNAYYR